MNITTTQDFEREIDELDFLMSCRAAACHLCLILVYRLLKEYCPYARLLVPHVWLDAWLETVGLLKRLATK
jgi:hypothetical protein